MKNLSKAKAWVLFAALPVSLALATAASLTTAANMSNGVWLTGDLHTHTFLTDGSHTEADVVGHAFDQFGLDFMANSEHGGTSARNPQGVTWDKVTPAPFIAGDPVKDKTGRPVMWRWQSLRDYSFPTLAALQQQYPHKTLIQGFEWNVPTHDHASVGIISDVPVAISDFEYQFDAGDKDTSRAYQGLVKRNATHADAVAAVTYLQQNYPGTSYVILNHPSRSLLYSAAAIRDLNNAAPSVCFGMEGFPGHQKESNRGGYGANLGENTYKARTYGGADYMVAKVGGLWDSLLGEGRRFWIFVNSDFHSAAADADFYPGEYAKTYVYARDNSPQAIVDALRSGNSFSVQGDLINALDFNVSAGSAKATMGGELRVKKGSNVKVVIRFKSPEKNNNGDKPAVDHVDLIVGEVTGRINLGDPNYNSDTNPTTRVLARFTSKYWTTDADGYNSIVYTLENVTKNLSLRLRGTNLGVNVPYETDADGNPLMDDLATQHLGLDNAQEAWADLWFYSNPIFISVVD